MRRRSLALLARWAPLSLWFCCVVTLMAALALGHQFALTGLDRHQSRLAAGLAELLRDGQRAWTSVHVLYTGCRCSQRIFEHLRVTERPGQLRELVLLAGDEREHTVAARLVERGFEVVPVGTETLTTRFGIEGAPTFVLVDPERRVRYLGGYTQRKQGSEIRDLAIVRELRQGKQLSDLPVFGCPVSQRLRALFEPFASRR